MAEIKEFIIDDGAKEYSFKNKLGEVFAEFVFNPTDTGIFSRYKEVVEYLEKLEVSSEISENDIVKMDEAIKGQFKYLLNTESDVFRKYTPLTVFADGSFYVEKALEIVGNIIEDETGKRIDKKIAKLKKLAAKNGH